MLEKVFRIVVKKNEFCIKNNAHFKNINSYDYYFLLIN